MPKGSESPSHFRSYTSKEEPQDKRHKLTAMSGMRLRKRLDGLIRIIARIIVEQKYKKQSIIFIYLCHNN